jgi:hypothetical protein
VSTVPIPATYPEHDKLSKVRNESQRIGEFLDWLSERGMQVMRWHEGDETVSGCSWCQPHMDEFMEQKCAERQRCEHCQGTHEQIEHVEGWVRAGSIQDILATYAEGIREARGDRRDFTLGIIQGIHRTPELAAEVKCDGTARALAALAAVEAESWEVRP